VSAGETFLPRRKRKQSTPLPDALTPLHLATRVTAFPARLATLRAELINLPLPLTTEPVMGGGGGLFRLRNVTIVGYFYTSVSL
jgi:hypothetical protein